MELTVDSMCSGDSRVRSTGRSPYASTDARFHSNSKFLLQTERTAPNRASSVVVAAGVPDRPGRRSARRRWTRGRRRPPVSLRPVVSRTPVALGGRGRSQCMDKFAAETKVEWREWGPEAFAAAGRAGKPVLLALRASWCEECHEMDRTTYAEPRIAANVNDGFVPVRVDVDRHPRVRDRYNMGGSPRASGRPSRGTRPCCSGRGPGGGGRRRRGRGRTRR